MKKISLCSVGALAMLLAGSGAWALDLGNPAANAAKDVTHSVSKSAVESEINKDLKKKNCAFKPKTTELNCDLSDVLGTLNEKRAVAEQSGFSNDVDIHVEVGQGVYPKNANLGYQRVDRVRNELRKKVSYWDWYDASVDGDKLNIFVKIQ